MTRRPASSMPRRPKRDRAKARAAQFPEDDRFAPHPNESIDVIYVIGRAAHLVGARPKEVVAVMLGSLAVAALSGAVANAAGATGLMVLDNVLLGMGVAWILGLLLQAPLVGAAIEVHTERTGLALEFLRRGVARIGALIVASLAVALISVVVVTVGYFFQLGAAKILGLLPASASGMLTIIATLALVIVGLRIITAFCLVVPIILIEDLSAMEALRRSWEIGWRNGMPIFLAVLLPALVAQGVLYLVGFMPTFISIPTAVALSLMMALYDSAIVPAAYVVIREYNDGLNPAHLLRKSRHR